MSSFGTKATLAKEIGIFMTEHVSMLVYCELA